VTGIDLDLTLGDIVTAHPALARELERRGLDYCCGGRRSLGDACRAAGVDPAAMAADLAAATDARGPDPWVDLDPSALVDHITTVHHRYLWAELPRLSALLERVVAAHNDRHPELGEIAALFAELRADLEPHLTKEERVLFPMIQRLADAKTRPTFHCGPTTNPISMMMLEHDRAGQILARLRAATNDYQAPVDGCASYRACYRGLAELEADTQLHIHKENNVLFPAVVELETGLPVHVHDGTPP
jgi:regulator of cell morphogenesis and NO signaling